MLLEDALEKYPLETKLRDGTTVTVVATPSSPACLCCPANCLIYHAQRVEATHSPFGDEGVAATATLRS